MLFSKVGAGLAVALLGTIGAVTAAKTHTAMTVYFQTGNSSNPCTATITNSTCPGGNNACVGTRANTPSLGKQYYQSVSSTLPSGICQTPLSKV